MKYVDTFLHRGFNVYLLIYMLGYDPGNKSFESEESFKSALPVNKTYEISSLPINLRIVGINLMNIYALTFHRMTEAP